METLPTCKIWNIRIFETVVGRITPKNLIRPPSVKTRFFPNFQCVRLQWQQTPWWWSYWTLTSEWNYAKQPIFGEKKASFLHFFGVLWKGIVAYDWELGVAISKIIIWLLISNLSISNLLLILMLFSFPKERRLTKKFQAISYWNVSLLTTPIFRQKNLTTDTDQSRFRIVSAD